MKTILILGGDGYLGFPLAVYLAERGYHVAVMDSLLKRKNTELLNVKPTTPYVAYQEKYAKYNHAAVNKIKIFTGDCADYSSLEECILVIKPDTIVHMAEQPSAPLSMLDYNFSHATLINNVIGTFNLAQVIIKNNLNTHIIKLGTMGEYGTPNIDIEEGWLNVRHNNREEIFLYPRQASSLYHTTKIIDTDLLWFYVRNNKLNVIDLMQGPVYGFKTNDLFRNNLSLEIYYDEIFGTVLNRFVVQAAIGHELTVYGTGNQIRGYINIEDSLKCIEIAINNTKKGLQIFNQFTEQFSVNQLADIVIEAGTICGLSVKKNNFTNPRNEKEEHYYNAKNNKLIELGLSPYKLTTNEVANYIRSIDSSLIDQSKIRPNTKW